MCNSRDIPSMILNDENSRIILGIYGYIIINHPYFDWGFSMVNLPAIGDAVFMETSISRISGISGSAVQVSPGPFCRTAVLGGGGAGGSRFAAAVAAGLKATTLAASGAWF